MRCPNCDKFVSYDEPEVEVDNYCIENEQAVGSVTITLNCAECGTPLAQAEEEFEINAHHPDGADEDHELEIKSTDVEGFDDYQTTNVNGKPIPSRYQKHFYGANISCEVECSCGWSETLTTDVKIQASSFDEC